MDISQFSRLNRSLVCTTQHVDMSMYNSHPNAFLGFKHEGHNLDSKHEGPSWVDGSPHSFEIPVNQMPLSHIISRSLAEVHNNIDRDYTDQIKFDTPPVVVHNNIDRDYADQVKFNEGAPGDICNIELYNTETMMDEFANQPIVSSCSSSAPVKKKKKTQWTIDEHKLFILGLKKYGKGDWKSISRNYVTTKSSTQVASHAQKYFNRREKTTRRKRSSIHDIVNVDDDSIVALVGKGLLSADKALSFLTSNTQLVSNAGQQHHVQLHPQIDETNIAREALLMCQGYPDYCGTNANSSSRFETQQTWDPPHQLQWGPLPSPQWR